MDHTSFMVFIDGLDFVACSTLGPDDGFFIFTLDGAQPAFEVGFVGETVIELEIPTTERRASW